jgi:hypothetical protein
MNESRCEIPSVIERARPVAAEATIVAAHFLDSLAVFILGEEALLSVTREGEQKKTPVHDGAILCSAADAGRIITGGDDGKVVITAADGSTNVLASDAKRRWIDHVATGANGAVAWSAGNKLLCAAAVAPSARWKYRRPSVVWLSPRRAFASPLLITMAPRSGFPIPRAIRTSWNGKARTSPSS